MQVVQAHEQRFYKGEGVLIHSEEGDLFHSLQMNDLQYHVELLEAVQKKNFHQANELIDKTLLYMRENHIVPRQVLEYTIFIINNLEGKAIEKMCIRDRFSGKFYPLLAGGIHDGCFSPCLVCKMHVFSACRGNPSCVAFFDTSQAKRRRMVFINSIWSVVRYHDTVCLA